MFDVGVAGDHGAGFRTDGFLARPQLAFTLEGEHVHARFAASAYLLAVLQGEQYEARLVRVGHNLRVPLLAVLRECQEVRRCGTAHAACCRAEISARRPFSSTPASSHDSSSVSEPPQHVSSPRSLSRPQAAGTSFSRSFTVVAGLIGVAVALLMIQASEISRVGGHDLSGCCRADAAEFRLTRQTPKRVTSPIPARQTRLEVPDPAVCLRR